MKKNEKIRTPLGIISVFKNEIPERYHCVVEPEISRISETHIRILTIDQTVSWGEEVYSPRLHQNCMNPENITLYPLEIEWNGDKVIVSDHYGMKEWITGEKLPEIQEWYPKLKKYRCHPCRNCGRC